MQPKEARSGQKVVLEALNNNLIELSEHVDDDLISKSLSGSLYYRNKSKQF